MQLLPVLASLLALSAPVSPARSALGTWRNPTGTLAVRTAACAGGLCGSIIWANGRALNDAHKAGVARLIGTAFLQNYRPAGHGSWTGQLYLPDMGRRFPSRIVQNGPNQLTISGCLIVGFLCRSQVWHRVG